MNVVNLSPASSTEDLRALQEVRDFASTDMGYGNRSRWTYRILSEPQIMPELCRLAHPGTVGNVDCVSFQPCPSHDAASQDRYSIETWNLPGGQWTFSGVYDGHCGPEVAEYTRRHLPAMLRRAIEPLVATRTAVDPDRIAAAIGRTITAFDNSITSDFLSLFPKGPTCIDAARWRVSMPTSDVSKVLRCTRGTTVLITLVDPRQENIWIANLGDCQAVLVSRAGGDNWQGRRINQIHNGSNDQELSQVTKKHPKEDECILDRRVLGFLSPTRVIGDTWMKLPAQYSRGVFMKFKEHTPINIQQEVVDRILTPPYLSNIPDVYHHRLRKARRDSVLDVALVICSDGLPDLYDDWEEQNMLAHWAQVIGQNQRRTPDGTKRQNSALRLLRDAIGGSDIHEVSRNLTVEMEERWMDDTTILVHHFV